MSIYTEEAERRAEERCNVCGKSGMTLNESIVHEGVTGHVAQSPTIMMECWTCWKEMECSIPPVVNPDECHESDGERGCDHSGPCYSCLSMGHDVREVKE